MSPNNPDGILLGKPDYYTQFLVLEKDKLKEKFLEDLSAWENAIEVAEKERKDIDDKVKKFEDAAQKLI